ncbi:hypothetical protein MVEG_06874 [Podila verticillata NRRL 6337]|nr:hypothetical protein MVEG_06874 [Podila verticillata NRRL 6337]
MPSWRHTKKEAMQHTEGACRAILRLDKSPLFLVCSVSVPHLPWPIPYLSTFGSLFRRQTPLFPSNSFFFIHSRLPSQHLVYDLDTAQTCLTKKRRQPKGETASK